MWGGAQRARPVSVSLRVAAIVIDRQQCPRYARASVIGHVIGNYRIVSELGRGGMGMVYRAEHVQLGRPAALKMLLPQMSSDPSIVQRFFNEARAASAIDHPGIVEVYDFGRLMLATMNPPLVISNGNPTSLTVYVHDVGTI